MSDFTLSYISLGSNLGDKRKYLDDAICRMDYTEGISIVKISSYLETEPWGTTDPQPNYLNAVVKISTSFSPGELLSLLQEIENKLGRQRPFRNAPRTIDLDILLYGREAVKEKNLVIPHPRMYQRPFILKLLQEVEPGILKGCSGGCLAEGA